MLVYSLLGQTSHENDFAQNDCSFFIKSIEEISKTNDKVVKNISVQMNKALQLVLHNQKQPFVFPKRSNCRFNQSKIRLRNCSQMSIPRIFILISIYLLREVTAQIVVALNTTNIVISNSTTLVPDPYYQHLFPSDSITFAAFTPTSIWTLSLNNTVQILDKTNLSLNLNFITQVSSDFRFQSTVPLSMIIFDENYGKAAITGYVNSCVVCYLYDNSNSQLPVLTRTITVTNIAAAPATSFIAGSTLYSFFSNKNKNDTILRINLLNSSTITFTLPTSSASLAISPNKKYALVWDQYTKVYIYSVPNFTLLYTYNDSITNPKDTTDVISFSSDGNLALIESDNHNPIVVLNLTSFTVIDSITIHGKITSVDFLDGDSRYILIVQNAKSYVYDLQLSLLQQFNATLNADSLIVDQDTSRMIVVLNNIRYVTNANISTGNTSVVAPEIFANTSTNASSVTNVTNNVTSNTSSTNQTSNFTNISSNFTDNTTSNATNNDTLNTTDTNTTISVDNTTNITDNTPVDNTTLVDNVTNTTSNTTNNDTFIDNTTSTNNSSDLQPSVDNTTNTNSSDLQPSIDNTTNNNSSDNQQNASDYASSNTEITHGMSYLLNLSQAQNQTFAGLQSASAVVLNVMTNFNLVVFSSPFTCFFLGFFNYFTLNSLYILLNIQLPDIIFKELSALYASSNANLLTSFGITFSPAPITHELVDSPRALYFAISSDLPSSNYYPIGLVILNSMLFELLLAIRTKVAKTHIAYSLLDFDRHQIYFGFAVYLMVGMILPSQFVLTRRLTDWPTVANSAVQFLLYIVITQFLWSSLIEALRGKKTKKATKETRDDKNNKVVKKQQKSQIPEWMIAFQNLLYPLLVLLPSPSFFLVAVLISKITEIVVFSKHARERGVSRALQVGSFLCEIIYHCTFIIFSLTRRQYIIIYNSLFCIIFFYVGAVLNLMWSVLFFIKLIKKIVKAKKFNNQVVDASFPLSKVRFQLKKRIPPLTIFPEKPIVAQKKLPELVSVSPPPSIDPIKKTVRKIMFKRPQLFLPRTVER